jgi:putative ABC transport system permease protein
MLSIPLIRNPKCERVLSMQTFWQDLRFGARMLLKRPSVTVIAVITLGLGIGANVAIFSVINGVLLNPLPYPEADRLMTLWERSASRGFEQERVSPPNLVDWQEQNSVFENLASWYGGDEVNLLTSDGVEKVKSIYASSSLFTTLNVPPLHGRVFLPEEDKPQGNRVAIISYTLWQRRYNKDPDVLGQTLTVDTYGRRDYTIIGVMPPSFRYPDECELWLPAGWNGLPQNRRGGHWLSVIARLNPDITHEQAQAEMNTIQRRIEEQYPDVIVGSQVSVVPLLEQTLGTKLRLALLILWGVVAAVLLIACANVANLMLARATARQGEIAIRLALGSSRWQIVRQLLTESLLLSIAGGLLGILLASWGLNLLVAFNADQIPRIQEVKLDSVALAFTVFVSVLTGVLFGLAPAMQASKTDLNEALKESGRRTADGAAGKRLRHALVVAEVALSLMLLIAAGLMVNSFARLLRIDRGFPTENLLTAQMDFSISGFTTWMRPTATRPQVTLKELMERIKHLPGVQSVAAINMLPKTIGSARRQPILFENRQPLPTGEIHTANFQGISPDYFDTLGIALLQGRGFTEADSLEAPQVGVINEAMAKRYFADENPLGKRLAMGTPNPNQISWIEIVGVVADTRKLNLNAEVVPDVYIPYWQYPMQSPSLIVRTTTNPTTLAATILSEVKAVNQNLPAPKIQAMDEILYDAVAEPRLQTLLLSLFGCVAMILASVGIYSVLAYMVTERTNEIGIRLALGAQTSDVLRMVIGQGMRLVGMGLAIGLTGAFALTRLMENLLFGVSAIDSMTYLIVTGLLASVALVACLVPARRAAKTDPMVALRYE